MVWQKMWVLICKILEVRCKRMHWGLRFGVCNKAKKIKGRKRAAVPPRGGGLQWCEKVVVLICKIFEVRCKRMH